MGPGEPSGTAAGGRAPSATGAELRLIFACPDCGAEGWVRWERLPRGMHCRACNGRFWIGQRGHLQSERLAGLRLHCPRCGETFHVPHDPLPKKIECPGCRLRISPGREAAHAVEDQARLALGAPGRRPGRPAGLGRRGRAWIVAGALALTAAGAALAGLGGQLRQRPPEEAAAELAALCAAGNADEARAMVLPEQQAAFDRWRRIAFALPANGRAPGLAGAQIAVRNLDRDGDAAVVRLLIASAAGSGSLQTQHWRRGPDGWRFDAERTLQALIHRTSD